MSSSIAQNIEALCQEQGIDRDLVIEAMKEAVRAAAKKQFRSGEDIQVDWNAETGIELSASKVVVDEVENPATELSIDEARELAEKAQKKKLFPRDYEGGTFTVSNLGMLGVDAFVAIINPPQCAILAVGRVAPRAVADEVGIAVRSMMTATLSVDHRIVDGAIAARFLADIKRRMENPAR